VHTLAMNVTYLHCARDVFLYTKMLRYQSHEVCLVLYLNHLHTCIHSKTLTSGIHNAVSFRPLDVLREGIMCNARGMILVHNHPSGEVRPSDNDIFVTKKIQKMGKVIGIELLDHVIVTEETYYSILAR